MRRCDRSRGVRALALAALLTASSGCESSTARYAPPADVARKSLEAALTAWRDGRPFGPIETTTPVRVADSLWQGGRQLAAFQIGEEQANADGTKRWFAVKLTMKKTNAVQDARYVVYGRDPVWVFSEADYRQMIDMDNGPEPARNRVAPGRSARR